MNALNAKSVILYKELASFFEDASNIPYVVIKGEPLSIYAYGKPGMRTSSDIDLLVSRNNLLKIEEMLKEQGFVSK